MAVLESSGVSIRNLALSCGVSPTSFAAATYAIPFMGFWLKREMAAASDALVVLASWNFFTSSPSSTALPSEWLDASSAGPASPFPSASRAASSASVPLEAGFFSSARWPEVLFRLSTIIARHRKAARRMTAEAP